MPRLEPHILENNEKMEIWSKKTFSIHFSSNRRPDQFVIIAIAFYWSFLVAFVPETPQVLCWGEAGGPRSRQRLLLDQDQRQRTAGLLWHAQLRWVLNHRSSSDRSQLHPIEPRFNTIQHNWTTIQHNPTQLNHNSTQSNTIKPLFNTIQHNWTTTQHNPTQLNHDSTQHNPTQLNWTKQKCTFFPNTKTNHRDILINS